MDSVFDNQLSIDQHKLHPCRILMGLLKARAVDDFVCIKDCHIGKVAFGNESAIVNPQSPGRLTAHLLDGFFQRNDAAFPDIVSEDPGKRAILPGMGRAFAKHSDRPIRPDSSRWMTHDPINILWPDGVINGSGAATPYNVKHNLCSVFRCGFHAGFQGQFRQILARHVRIPTVA